jgi:hypothetical protein
MPRKSPFDMNLSSEEAAVAGVHGPKIYVTVL